jgi:hypothetical protein
VDLLLAVLVSTWYWILKFLKVTAFNESQPFHSLIQVINVLVQSRLSADTDLVLSNNFMALACAYAWWPTASSVLLHSYAKKIFNSWLDLYGEQCSRYKPGRKFSWTHVWIDVPLSLMPCREIRSSWNNRIGVFLPALYHHNRSRWIDRWSQSLRWPTPLLLGRCMSCVMRFTGAASVIGPLKLCCCGI